VLLVYREEIGKIEVDFLSINSKYREKSRHTCRIFLTSDYFGVVSGNRTL